MGLLAQISSATGSRRPDVAQAEKAVLDWTDAIYQEARAARDDSPEWADQPRYLEYLRSKQWGANRQAYQSSPVVNRFWNLFWEKVSLLTDLRLYTGKVYPCRNSDETFWKAATALTNTLFAWWMQTDADWAFEMAVIYSLLSTGYGRVSWNPYAANGLGNFELRGYGMDKVMPLGMGGPISEAEAVVFEEPRSIRWFRESFRTKGALVEPDREITGFGSSRTRGLASADSMSPGMRRLVGTPRQSASGSMPYAMYREFWTKDPSLNELDVPVIVGGLGTPWCYAVMPGEPLYPRGRLTRRGGDIILDDGPNTNLDGGHPFVDMKPYDLPWLQFGMTELRAWIPGQDITNQLLAGFLSQMKKAQNPPLLIPKGSMADGDIPSLDSSRAGTKIVYNATLSPQPPQWQRQPSPVNVIPPINLVLSELDRMSGVGAAQRALTKQQVPGGEAFDRIRQAQSTPLRRQERVEERFIKQCARLAIARICQYYSEERVFYMGGDDAKSLLRWEPRTVRDLDIVTKDDKERLKERESAIVERWRYKLLPRLVEDLTAMDSRAHRLAATIREFALYIKPNSLFDLEKPSRVAIAFRMWMQKGLSLKGLYEELGVERSSNTEITQIISEMKLLEAAGIAPAGAKQRASGQHAGGGKTVPASPKG